MKVAFLKVSNSKGLRLCDFEDLYEDEIVGLLKGLDDSECRVYEMSLHNGASGTLTSFVQDFNDGEINDTWWAIFMPR